MVNENGLTWERWLAATGWGTFYSYEPTLEMQGEWLRGIDPTEWRKFFDDWKEREVKRGGM